jgi:UDP-N-acetylmuramoylalanine--D-glutamate ligase
VILVYGLAVAGEATARALLRRGLELVAADDVATPERMQLAADLGIDLVVAPDAEQLDRLVQASDLIVPAPGVPESHALFGAARARGVEVVSEIELAYRWEQERPGGPRPMLAVTGTDGKTTTTMMTVAILEAAGLRSVAAGNTEVPLVTALDLDVDAFAVECTSFRLAWTSRFRAESAAWLNLAPDHLNWHDDYASYGAAKSAIYAHQRPTDAAIGYAADDVVMSWLSKAPARHVTYGSESAEYRVADGALVGPTGQLADVASLARRLPHDLNNSLAAAALVLEAGLGGADAVAAGLARFQAPPHRIEFVADVGGVAYYNDSKATTPHAAATAIAGFDRVVLIAGGSRKGVDLAPMAAEPQRIAAVVAIGDSGDDVAALFGAAAPHAAIHRASSMPAAVDVAGAAARPGDVVLLSPGCASFDWYRNYEARGDDFRSIVRAIPGAGTADSRGHS